MRRVSSCLIVSVAALFLAGPIGASAAPGQAEGRGFHRGASFHGGRYLPSRPYLGWGARSHRRFGHRGFPGRGLGFAPGFYGGYGWPGPAQAAAPEAGPTEATITYRTEVPTAAGVEPSSPPAQPVLYVVHTPRPLPPQAWRHRAPNDRYARAKVLEAANGWREAPADPSLPARIVHVTVPQGW